MSCLVCIVPKVVEVGGVNSSQHGHPTVGNIFSINPLNVEMSPVKPK